MQVLAPLATGVRSSRGVLWVADTNIGGPGKCTSSLLGETRDLGNAGGECKDGVHCLCPQRGPSDMLLVDMLLNFNAH